MEDFNAKIYIFHNCTSGRTDIRGKQLYSLCMTRNLQFLGHNFNTYRNNDKEGEPDVILANNQFQMFQHLITKGAAVRSDHINMLLQLSLLPIKVLCHPRSIICKLDKKLFQNLLKDDIFERLDGKQANSINHVLETITNNINNATMLSFLIKHNKVISSYDFTKEINDKFVLLQSAYCTYFLGNSVSLYLINALKRDIILKMSTHQSKSWKQLTDLAAANFGDPLGFWRDFNKLRGGKKSNTSSLKLPPDTDDFDEGCIISDPSEKLRLMRICWEKIFPSNQGPEFINENTKKVNTWCRSIKQNLQHGKVVDFSKLDESSPIFRGITVVEFCSVVSHAADKAPCKDGTRIKQLKALSPNYVKAIMDVLNSTLASKCFPKLSKDTSMIFVNRPSKDPFGYWPISLLNILRKLLEKIIA